MIKCPKCQFEQPSDTYCANCGINMDTYRPEPKPFFKSLLTNSMFHLLLVIVAIVSLVLYDRGSDAPITATQSRVASRSTAPVEPPPSAAEKIAPEPAMAEVKIAPPEPEPTPVAAATVEPAREIRGIKRPNPTANRPLKHTVKVTFYQASKNVIADMMRETQSGSFNGEAIGGILTRKNITKLKSSHEVKSLSANIFKDVDNQHPIMVFKGQRSNVAAKNMGLFFQITPLREDTGTLQLEIKSWGNLKMTGNEENLFLSEMSLSAQSGAFIAGFLPKDKTFTDDEKSVFESDRTLKIYNNEDFWDGSLDLIMVIELTGSAA
jgi:hypothetical protein